MSLVVQRKVSGRGGIQVAGQRIQVGFSHAGQTVTIDTGHHPADDIHAELTRSLRQFLNFVVDGGA
jgi:hypothetical protein